MKTHLMAMMCMGVFLWCFGFAEAGQADWKVLQDSKYGDTWSYDAASVKNTESNTVMVRTKTQRTEYLYEIDCKNRKARIFEKAGDAGSAWFDIKGADELLYKEVCP